MVWVCFWTVWMYYWMVCVCVSGWCVFLDGASMFAHVEQPHTRRRWLALMPQRMLLKQHPSPCRRGDGTHNQLHASKQDEVKGCIT